MRRALAVPEAKPLASLSSALLARKGYARPAMRPQMPLTAEEQQRLLDAALVNGSATPEDLGWNDMGTDALAGASDPAPIRADVTPQVDAPVPEVHRQIAALVEKINGTVSTPASAPARAPAEAVAPRPSRRKGSALEQGRKAAFTLRLDEQRHMRLRLASALVGRSAQALVVDALDRLLEAMLDAEAPRVRPDAGLTP